MYSTNLKPCTNQTVKIVFPLTFGTDDKEGNYANTMARPVKAMGLPLSRKRFHGDAGDREHTGSTTEPETDDDGE